ncbi:unnamed protein product [Malus baccata var. baccata]
MGDSFRVRADKVFGSIPSSTSSFPKVQQSSPWSVTGDAVERREWKRGKDAGTSSNRDQTPCSSSFLEDEWGIKASIGKDPTLDFEEEEDEYDKVAAGTEGVSDRLYMDEIANHGPFLNSQNVLHGSNKDPRANFLAAKLRLKEDDAEARKSNSTLAAALPVKKQTVESPEDGGRPKSILKRKGYTSDTKVQKRVRFDPAFVAHSHSKEAEVRSDVNGMVSGPSPFSIKAKSKLAKYRQVPDYLVNPSKYTYYSFDTTAKVDEVANAQVCTEYLTPDESSNSESRSETEDSSPKLPVSVTFVPKKKRGDDNAVNDSNKMKLDREDDKTEYLKQAGIPVGIAAVEVQSDVSAVEEEGSQPSAPVASVCVQKSGRKYRKKTASDESDS